MVSSLVACAALAALLLLFTRRAIVDRRIRDERRRRWPPMADGVVDGASTIAHAGSRGTVLVLHGFGDTPQSVATVAHALHASGYAVHVPLLPGHGRTLEAFSRSRAREWKQVARDAYTAIAGTDRVVAVVGVSMGGALACHLIATLPAERRPDALVLITPFLHRPFPAALLTYAWPLWSLVQPWVPGSRQAAIFDAAARERSRGYGVASPRLLRELRTVVDDGIRASSALRLPTLAIFSAHDYRIPTSAALAIYARLGSAEKSIHWFERSGHVITADSDAEDVAALVRAWLDRTTQAGA